MLNKEHVAHIAHLSRLHLTDTELDVYSLQLQAIMHYMEKLQTIDTTGVALMYNPSPSINHVRKDIPGVSLSQEAALAMAPACYDGRFSVPQMVGGDQ